MTNHRSIPGLDGLRAISIGIVLLSHVIGTAGFPVATQRIRGWIGVHVFFVISGYLITRILTRELEQSGTINLPRFYTRRTLRLFPAAYTFIAVVAVLAAAGIAAVPAVDFIFAGTYTANYHTARSWSLGHLWSLAVEEQFYLLWPAALLWAGVRRAELILVALIVIAPAARMFQTSFQPAMSFLVFSDALAIGCLLALRQNDLHKCRWYMRFRESWWFALVPPAAVALAYTPSIRGLYVIGLPLMGLLIAAGVDWAVGRNGGVLNSPPLMFIGRISYSLYLWQQLFLNRESTSPLCAWPLNIALAFAAALASYYLIEQPVLARRDRKRSERREVVVSDLRSTRDANVVMRA
jgi:peptidoglycan/LPS O-acetylase OafA/YrhL